jgi:Calcineurin-like phosphoesterase
MPLKFHDLITAPLIKIHPKTPEIFHSPSSFLRAQPSLQPGMSDVRKLPKSRREAGLSFSTQKRKRDGGPDEQYKGLENVKLRRMAAPQIHKDDSDNEVPQSPQPHSSSKRFHRIRILIISDTHGKAQLPQPIHDGSIDVVLHCGDLSECGDLEDYRNSISLLNSIPAELKLVIPGNHDLTLDEVFWSRNSTSSGAHLHEAAKEIWKGKAAVDAGIVFLADGFHEFTLTWGAMLRVYASSATPQPSQATAWAFGYPSNVDRYNPKGTGI